MVFLLPFPCSRPASRSFCGRLYSLKGGLRFFHLGLLTSHSKHPKRLPSIAFWVWMRFAEARLLMNLRAQQYLCRYPPLPKRYMELPEMRPFYPRKRTAPYFEEQEKAWRKMIEKFNNYSKPIFQRLRIGSSRSVRKCEKRHPRYRRNWFKSRSWWDSKQLRKEMELFRVRIFLLLNRLDNEMSMFQLISEFGESVKLEDFAVDYSSIRKRLG